MAQKMERTMAGKDGAKKSGGAGGDGDGDGAGKAGGKKKLIIIAGAVVLLLAGGGGGAFFVMNKASASTEKVPAVEEPVAGAVVALDPITINLADGRYLKLGIALQATEAAAAGGGEHGGGGPDGSEALDLTIEEFSGLSMTDLSNAEQRKHYKDELQAKIVEAYTHEAAKEGDPKQEYVMGIYFTQFVMQ